MVLTAAAPAQHCAPPAPRPRNRQVPALLVVLVTAVLATFWPVSRNNFINFDDTVMISANTHVLQGPTASSIRWAFVSLDSANWIPVTRLGHLMNVYLFGMRPGWHHLVSVVYHALAAALLLLALHRMTGRPLPAFFIAALFALHPLRVESVAWAAELKDPLSGCFFSLSLLAYLAYTARPSAARYLLLVGIYAFGLMAKPTLVPLPFVLLLLDYWPLGRLDRKAAAEKIPLLLLTAAMSTVTYIAQVHGHAVSSLAVHSLRARVVNALAALLSYLGKFLWPENLAVVYPQRAESFSSATVVAGAALLLVFTGLAVHQARRRPWLAVGWFWYLGFLVPVIGLVQVGVQSMADRYTYLPLIGIAFALCMGIAEAEAPSLRRSLLAAASLILVALASESWRTAGFWRDDATLFGHAVDVIPENGPALAHLGAARSAEGQLEEAATLLRRSVAITPDYAFAHNTLGNVLSRQGRELEAMVNFRAALRLFPGWADAHNNLGASLATTGRFDEAALHFKAALAAQPGMTEATDNLRKVAPFLHR